MKENITYTLIFALVFIVYYYPESLQLIYSLSNIIKLFQKVKINVKIIIKLTK